MGVDERHAQGAPPRSCPSRLSSLKPVVRTMPASRAASTSAPWAATPGQPRRRARDTGPNLIEIDVKDENGEVSGLGG